MKKSLLLIDGNSLGYACQHISKLRTKEGMEVQAIYGFINMLGPRLAARQATPLVLWDGKAQWRYDYYPDYKSERGKDEKSLANRMAYKKQQPYLTVLLEALGVMQVRAPEAEADDIAGQLVPVLLAQDLEVELMTSDTDWLQSMQPRVTWTDPRSGGQQVTSANFSEFTGYATPAQYLQGKSLVGDGSDSIGGIDRIGEKTAPKILNAFGSVDAFFTAADTGQVDLTKTVFRNLAAPEGRDVYFRNMRLMDFSQAPPLTARDIVCSEGIWNPEFFLESANRLNFKSYTRNASQVLAPFERAYRQADYDGWFKAMTALNRQ